MKSMLMILKRDGSGSYLLEYREKTLLPLFSDYREVKEFMAARSIDPDEYRMTDTTFGFVEKMAEEAQESGIEHYTFGPSPNPEDPVMRVPIDNLIGEAQMMQGKR